jgi:glycine/D-amino acid oxidase-like deaminating enzyme
VALIGGGFTSLWTAYLLLRESPGLDVAILESHAIGYGASGRNGGFAMTLVHRTLAHLAAQVGDDEARRIYLAAKQAVEHIGKTVEAESIQCDVQSNGLITLSNSAPQDRIVHKEVETAERLGLAGDFAFLDREAARERIHSERGDFAFLDREAARERIHSERIRCAFYEDACTLVNPARLARGLGRVVERLGARVFEGTPVETWEEGSEGVMIRTPDGTLRADRALVAGNAYGSGWASTRRSVLPFYSYICLTRPLTAPEWESVGWAGREGAEDRRVGLHYFRPTIDGRILWGGRDPVFQPDGPRAVHDRDEAVFRRLRESFDWFFPQLRGVPFEHRWGGPIAVTGDFMPAVGWFDDVRRRVAFAYGYNGHGVAISNVAAHAVADLFAGRQSEWTELRFVGGAPQDLGPRWLRDPLVRRTVTAQIRADDEERETKEPLALRILNRFTGTNLRNT